MYGDFYRKMNPEKALLQYKCVKCSEYVVNNYFVCLKGHTYCEECRSENCSNCVWWQSVLKPVNVGEAFYDYVTANAFIRCKNYALGCKEKHYANVNTHVCKFAPKTCPFLACPFQYTPHNTNAYFDHLVYDHKCKKSDLSEMYGKFTVEKGVNTYVSKISSSTIGLIHVNVSPFVGLAFNLSVNNKFTVSVTFYVHTVAPDDFTSYALIINDKILKPNDIMVVDATDLIDKPLQFNIFRTK